MRQRAPDRRGGAAAPGAAAGVQVRPGPTHGQVLEMLAEAFIAETLAVGGIAITRVCPELLRPGIAVAARPAVIEHIAARFTDAAAADPFQVQQSRHFGERW